VAQAVLAVVLVVEQERLELQALVVCSVVEQERLELQALVVCSVVEQERLAHLEFLEFLVLLVRQEPPVNLYLLQELVPHQQSEPDLIIQQ